MKRFITRTSENYKLLDSQTGELLDYRQTIRVSMEEFIMIFFASYPDLMKLGGQKLKVLMVCWKYSTFGNPEEGNVIVNDKVFKGHVREYEPNMSDGSIDVAISELARKGLIVKQCKGRYVLNHRYFFKGKLSDRSKLRLNFIVDSKDGKTGEPVRTSVCFFAYCRRLKEGEEDAGAQEVDPSSLE